MFTDESRFYSDSSDGRSRVYRQDGKRYSDACVGQRRIFEGEIMQRRVILCIRKQQNLIVLQQDHAKLHVARVVRDFVAQ